MRALHHATYVFEKRLSHTADSQDQRHRMVPASRPLMTFADTSQPDYITPRLIAANPRARAVYDCAMREAWAAKNRLLELGVPLEFALYVLPNAKTLRFVESGSLLALLHKWTLRTCFNAQEEIYLASMDEIEQVRAVASAHRPPHRAALRHPQRPDLAALHRGHALLRRAGVARLPGRRPPAVISRHVVSAWLVHLYTASGAVLAFLAARRRHRASTTATAFFWLALPVVVDATDGVLARRARVSERLPWFNGAKLDDIVDYLTYVFVPALFVWRALLVPGALGASSVPCAMLLSSAYGFSRDDAKTADHFFTGFPSYWNIVVFYLYLAGWPPLVNAAVLLALAVLVFVPIRYVYPSRTPVLRSLTIGLGIVWGVLMLVMLWQMPAVSRPSVLDVADLPALLRRAVAACSHRHRSTPAEARRLACESDRPSRLQPRSDDRRRQLDVADSPAACRRSSTPAPATTAPRRARGGAAWCGARAGAGHTRAFGSCVRRDGAGRALSLGDGS